MRWSVLVLLACAFALRCLNLTFQPLWFDEGWSVWFATTDLATMAARTAADIHPPLYYALLHGWIAGGGKMHGPQLLCVRLADIEPVEQRARCWAGRRRSQPRRSSRSRR